MKILQTIAGFGAHSGGTSTCTYDLLTAMHQQGCDVDLMTVQTSDIMGQGESWIKALPDDGISSYGYSHNINCYLKESDYDLYHTNGLWMHCNHETCAVARQKGKPYIITPHGMLYPQALARSAWKKKMLLSLGGVDRDLRSAACIHATCKAEMEYYRQLGYGNPVAVIPNPVPLPDFINDIQRDDQVKRIGFLGRLHPVKNVESLLDAWILLGNKVADAQLVIMGKGDADYEQMLKDKVASHGLDNVKFVGFVTGREKFERLASLTALCVPSYFESFGMIVTESLSVGSPVIASLGTPWQELETCHCGRWVDNSVKTLAETIESQLALPLNQINQMGENGKALVAKKYKADKVAAMMSSLYDWVQDGGILPPFVQM
jgi:glycosyltransferase involved in cell wall biosynthesis